MHEKRVTCEPCFPTWAWLIWGHVPYSMRNAYGLDNCRQNHSKDSAQYVGEVMSYLDISCKPFEEQTFRFTDSNNYFLKNRKFTYVTISKI